MRNTKADTMENGKKITIKFSDRRTDGKIKQVTHVYHAGIKVFQAYTDQTTLNSFLELIYYKPNKSKSGKTVYIDGENTDELLKRIVIFLGCKECTRSSVKVRHVMEAIAELNEIEALFWYSRIIELYKKKKYIGVCRVAKSFSLLYGID